MSISKYLNGILGESPTRIPALSDEDRKVILRFARGEFDLREAAVSVYRSHADRGMPRNASPEMRFMAEVDHKAPVIELRGRYRSELLMADIGRDNRPLSVA